MLLSNRNHELIFVFTKIHIPLDPYLVFQEKALPISLTHYS